MNDGNLRPPPKYRRRYHYNNATGPHYHQNGNEIYNTRNYARRHATTRNNGPLYPTTRHRLYNNAHRCPKQRPSPPRATRHHYRNYTRRRHTRTQTLQNGFTRPGTSTRHGRYIHHTMRRGIYPTTTTRHGARHRTNRYTTTRRHNKRGLLQRRPTNYRNDTRHARLARTTRQRHPRPVRRRPRHHPYYTKHGTVLYRAGNRPRPGKRRHPMRRHPTTNGTSTRHYRPPHHQTRRHPYHRKQELRTPPIQEWGARPLYRGGPPLSNKSFYSIPHAIYVCYGTKRQRFLTQYVRPPRAHPGARGDPTTIVLPRNFKNVFGYSTRVTSLTGGNYPFFSRFSTTHFGGYRGITRCPKQSLEIVVTRMTTTHLNSPSLNNITIKYPLYGIRVSQLRQFILVNPRMSPMKTGLGGLQRFPHLLLKEATESSTQ